MFNAYLYTASGQRLVLVCGVPYDQAEQLCLTEAHCLPATERLGNRWYQPGGMIRMVIYDERDDPFADQPAMHVSRFILRNLSYAIYE